MIHSYRKIYNVLKQHTAFLSRDANKLRTMTYSVTSAASPTILVYKLWSVYAVCIGYTKYVASISDHVKIGSATCLFWLPLLENRGSQNSSEQSCDYLLLHSISVPKIRSTPNSKWSSLEENLRFSDSAFRTMG